MPSRCDWAHGVLATPDQYSPPLVQQVLDEMANLAASTGSEFVQGEATSWIGHAGRGDAGFQQPVAGVVERLRSLYRSSNSYATRRSIVELMGHQADKNGAADFLENVAREAPPSSHAEPLPVLAARSLGQLGPIGEERLQRLRGEHRVHT